MPPVAACDQQPVPVLPSHFVPCCCGFPLRLGYQACCLAAQACAEASGALQAAASHLQELLLLLLLLLLLEERMGAVACAAQQWKGEWQ